MEVHHHPDLHHKKKNFREYFLEFIMIFLAVTMGFIAESIREHVTDRSKETEYISGFIRNLRDDTANLKYVINFDNKQVAGTDSILRLSHSDMSIDSNRKAFYYFAFKYLYNSASFKSNDATLQQLKSTGDYRLIEKDHVADSLSKYDADTRGVYDEGNYYEVYFKDILSRMDDIGDMTIIQDTSYIKNGKMTAKPLPQLRNDGNKLPTFYNKISDFGIITQSYSKYNLQPQLDEATRLIDFLRKEYDIND